MTERQSYIRAVWRLRLLSEIGKFLRRLRIDKGELLKTMADKLGVTSSYLSAVEMGKRPMPQEWFTKIITIYELNREQQAVFREAEAHNATSVTFDLKNSGVFQRETALCFARSFEKLDDASLKHIMELLQSAGI